MRATDRSLDIVAFVSEHFRDILRRRLSEIAGLALITLALLGAVALTTWSVQDPSLSHATQTPVHNLLGYPGAIFSDLAMQLLGLAAVLLLMPEALYGWRLLAHRPVGDKWRGPSVDRRHVLCRGLRLDAAAYRFLAAADGLGGVSGDAMLHALRWIFGTPASGLATLLMSVLFGIATALTFAIAAGLRWPERQAQVRAVVEEEEDSDETEDEGDEDRASAWKGMIVHALLSWKARIGRMIRGAPARTPMRAARPRRRPP
ncbi:MAG: DNA translocase FtsK 4TM domain-containing protein [Pseudolabrys sp.]